MFLRINTWWLRAKRSQKKPDLRTDQEFGSLIVFIYIYIYIYIIWIEIIYIYISEIIKDQDMKFVHYLNSCYKNCVTKIWHRYLGGGPFQRRTFRRRFLILFYFTSYKEKTMRQAISWMPLSANLLKLGSPIKPKQRSYRKTNLKKKSSGAR